MKSIKFLDLALVIWMSVLAAPLAIGQGGVSVSVSVKPICEKEFSHELRISWKVTGFSGSGEVTVTLTMPDGETPTFKPNTGEGTFAAPVNYPQGGRVQLQIKASASGDSASASGSATLGQCRDRVRPTIRVNPASGIAGSPIQITGSGAAGSPSVRLVWKGAQGTQVFNVSPVDLNGRYRSQSQIPPDATAGLGQVCAVETGSAFGRFVCADFEVKPTPPGSIEGTVRDPTTGTGIPGAQVLVRDLFGNLVGTTTSGNDGRFRVHDLSPGKYKVSALKPGFWFDFRPVVVQPGQSTPFNPSHDTKLGPATSSPCVDNRTTQWVRVKDVSASLDGISDSPGEGIPEVGYFLSLPRRGVSVMNTFTTTIEHSSVAPANVSVRYTVGAVSHGSPILEREVGPPWQLTLDMSELPPGEHSVIVRALNKTKPECSAEAKGFVLKILEDRWFKDWVRSPRVSWNESERRYQFKGNVPPVFSVGWEPDFSDVDGILGDMLRAIFRRSEASSDIVLDETFRIEGKYDAKAEVNLKTTVLGFDLGDKKKSLNVISSNPPEYELPFVEIYGWDSGRIPIYHTGFKVTIDMPWPWDDKTLGYGFDVYGGVKAAVHAKGTVNHELKVGEIRIQLGVDPYVGAELWADVGVANGTATAEGHGYLGVPFVYRPDNPFPPGTFGVESPCFGLYLPLRISLDILGVYDWSYSETYSWDRPSGCMPRRTLGLDQASQTSPLGTVLAMPAVAADGAGGAIAVWVEDQDPNPRVVNSEIVYSIYDGSSWGAPKLLTNNDRFETDPQVAFLGSGKAMALWTQNEIPRGRTEKISLDQALNSQELYYSLWDGKAWTTPARLTNDDKADGRPALAGDLTTGRAVAAWVHDTDGQNKTPGDLEIYTALWDGRSWTRPTTLHADSRTADLQATVALTPDGKALVFWVRDHDLRLGTSADRRLAYAVWDGLAWSTPEEPSSLPSGAINPDVAFDAKGQPVVVFAVPGTDASRRPHSPLGQFNYLWAAYHRDGAWEVAPIGQQTAVERPQVSINSANQATVVFRQFGEPNTVHYTGEVAAATADLNAKPLRWSEPGFLTNDAQTDWQIAFAQDPRTFKSLILQVKEPAPASANAPAMADAHMATAATPSYARTMTLGQTAGGSAVTALTVPYGIDLAINASDITFSDDHPLPGQPVKVTATIRNLGTAPVTSPFVVRLVLDPDANSNGMEIGRRTVTTPMSFNAAIPVTVDWIAPGGVHHIQAIVDADNEAQELNENNNKTIQRTGQLAAPTDLTASTGDVPNALQLAWKAPNTVNISGYRVYRSLKSGGPYELVGETLIAAYTDLALEYQQTYYYAVRAYDPFDTQSPPSPEAMGKTGAAPKLPLQLSSEGRPALSYFTP
jgi:hypothetical protein